MKSLQTWSKSIKTSYTFLKAIDGKYIYGRVELSCKENVWRTLDNAEHVVKLIMLDCDRAAGTPIYCPTTMDGHGSFPLDFGFRTWI